MRFGRSNDPTSTAGLSSLSSETMSRRTRSVAVAVNAWSDDLREISAEQRQLAVLGPEIVAPLADAVRLVHGDVANAALRSNRRRKPWLPSPTSRSGDTYNSRQRPALRPATTASRSSGLCVLFRNAAATPSTRRPST